MRIIVYEEECLMSTNRFFPYDLTDVRARIARDRMLAVCEQYGVAWPLQFRQKDLFEKFKKMFGLSAQYESGLCQVVSVMYANIRDLFLGQPLAAQDFFQCWYLRDREGAAQILGHFANDLNVEAILHDYFDDAGSKSFIGVTDALWTGMPARMLIVKKSDAGEEIHIYQRQHSKQITFKERKFMDRASSVDVDFVHECNPAYLMMQNDSYMYLFSYDELASAFMRVLDPYIVDAKPMRITIQMHNANEPKIDTNHMISLLRLPDSNFIELIDANRGVFLIPCDSRKM